AIRAVVEALAGHVHVVGVEDAVHEARRHPARAELRAPLRDRAQEALHRAARRVAAALRGELREMPLDGRVEEAAQLLGLAEHGQALVAPEADVRVRETNEHGRARRRRLVAAMELLAGLEEAERLRRVDAERLQHLGREDLSNAALQRQATVAVARPRRPPAALRPEVEQAAVEGIEELSEQEAAPVAERRVVRPELVPVVAERERLAQVVGQRLEEREVALPLFVVERSEADPLRPALVP